MELELELEDLHYLSLSLLKALIIRLKNHLSNHDNKIEEPF